MFEKIKKILKKWWLFGGILAIIIIILLNFISKPKFEITDFSITRDVTEYTYTENSVYYDGKGIITTKDKKGVYLVILNVKRVSGGREELDNENEYNTTVLVVDGKGNFATYDYGSENEVKKPKYEFEILGYIKVNKK